MEEAKPLFIESTRDLKNTLDGMNAARMTIDVMRREALTQITDYLTKVRQVAYDPSPFWKTRLSGDGRTVARRFLCLQQESDLIDYYPSPESMHTRSGFVEQCYVDEIDQSTIVEGIDTEGREFAVRLDYVQDITPVLTFLIRFGPGPNLLVEDAKVIIRKK